MGDMERDGGESASTSLSDETLPPDWAPIIMKRPPLCETRFS